MKPDRTTRQLADATLQLLSQNRLLEDLRNDLLRIVRRIPPAEPAARELRDRIGKLPHQLIDWEKHDRQFNAIFPEFLQSLRERVPDVTQAEMRICMLVRMQLQSREIAGLLDISVSGVDSRRRNIRRKLGLKKGEKLQVALGGR